MRKGKIGFGIVGYGVIGTFHAKAIRDARDAELVAVCDTDPKQEAVMRKEGWNVPFYARETEMYRKESDLDAVCICTPSGLHYRSAVNAARHGRHVLSEKPLDITLAHMDRMIDACDEAGVKLGCIFQRHADPDHILAHKAIRKGLLGRLVLGDCYQKYYRAPAYYKSAAWRGTWKLDGGGA
ncbi:MAG: Gfo/Idh/MocA family oxidoreductase, partial [Lentisphaerae bacterium]|nr:Gfo/Idh/MocA family oxidoreductase [Lentisphaerota bacterium]